jgi:predicted carbohydrate-binding protein with CBM5 and CBM33 domain
MRTKKKICKCNPPTQFKGEMVLRAASDRVTSVWDAQALLHQILDYLERHNAIDFSKRNDWILQMTIKKNQQEQTRKP